MDIIGDYVPADVGGAVAVDILSLVRLGKPKTSLAHNRLAAHLSWK